MQTTPSPLVPLLVVRGARRAVDFYTRALGATVVACYEHGAERRISHVDLTVHGVSLAVTEEARAWNSDAPPSLGGSPVVLQLHVSDTDGVVESMCRHGATVVFPSQELLGERMARVRDPFGHLWLLHQRLQELTHEAIQRLRDELVVRFAGREPSQRGAAPPARVEDPTTLCEAPTPLQAPSDPGSVHVVIGPVGAGKSTFARRLAERHAAIRFTLDDWMTTLFSPDRPHENLVEWYLVRSARCVEQIWKLACESVALGTNAILEIGLLKRCEREDFYRRVSNAGIPLTVHVIDAKREVRRERVMQRNQQRGATFSMLVPPAVFELASDLWEPPDPNESGVADLHFVRTDE